MAAHLALLVIALPATPALAQDVPAADPVGPVRADRFRNPAAAWSLQPRGAQGDARGPAAPAAATAAASALEITVGRRESEPRSAWVVAGAALAGGALGWAIGSGGTLLATRDRLARDDLAPLLYAAIGGAAVSVPAGAVAGHWASRGHGSVLASTLMGYAAAGIAMAAWPDGGWALGPALAIPITIAVEAL